jgi:hypothetical protein
MSEQISQFHVELMQSYSPTCVGEGGRWGQEHVTS